MDMSNSQCDDNICVVCCLQFTKRKSRKKRKSDCNDLFYIHKLHESLADIEGDALSSELSKYYQSLICPNCISCVASTLVKEDLLNGLEEKVRELQVEILKLLNRIQNEVKDFSKELDKLEGIVKGSRENVNRLDEFYLMKMEHDQKEEEDAEGLASTKLKDAISFRERILSVFDGLCSFNKEINEFNGRSSTVNRREDGDQDASSVFKPIPQNKRSKPEVIRVIRDERRTPQKNSRDERPKLEDQRQNKNENQDLKETCHRSKEDEGESEPIPPLNDCDNSDMNPNSPPDNLMDPSSREVSNAEEDDDDDDYDPGLSSSARKRSTRVQTKRESNRKSVSPVNLIDPSSHDASNAEEDGSEGGGDYDPGPSQSARKRGTRERTKRKSNRKSVLPDSPGDSSSTGDTSNDEDDFDMDFRPGQKAKKKPSFYKVHLKRDKHIKSILSTYDFSGMTPFKKSIITRFITKTERLKYEETEGPTPSEKLSKLKQTAIDDIDPTKIHQITYNQTTDTLNLCDFQVTINQQTESVECTNCGVSLKAQIKCIHDIETFMYNHILGFHLKLFTCPHCQKILISHLRFKTHVLGHLNMYACDICGKPLKGPDILKQHKYQHMNQEERKAAAAKERDGMNPLEKIAQYQRKQNLERKYQCSTCGKGYATTYQLKMHEEAHQNKRDYMCPNCGKTYKNQSALYGHVKYACFPGKREVSGEIVYRFHCDKCDMKFTLQSRLQRHKLSRHTVLESKFKCDLCEKSFKLPGSLRIHKRTHSDVRKYACKNGCGASFKASGNCKRHERTCKHVGGNV